MPRDRVDLAILGGGLAGGLVALALAERRPEIKTVVIEPGPVGGNHIWSHFGGDLDHDDGWLVEPLVAARWPAYDVSFPTFTRTLCASYSSVTSERFAAVLAERMPTDSMIIGRVEAARPGRVRLVDGREIAATAVIDARGPGDVSTLELGYQKFVGQLLQVPGGHGIERPVVMDATVEQADGYRFAYLLPFSPKLIFVEDTYYSDTPSLARELLIKRIGRYAESRGWRDAEVVRTESGVLPVVIGGDFAAYWASTGNDLAKAGMRAGLFHPTTGYSFPDAVRLAALIAATPDLSQEALRQLTHDHAARLWRGRGFYRLLDVMLFRAADPAQRYRVLQRFYRLPPALVERFYAAESTRRDQVRVLSGRPPVRVDRAVRAIMASRATRSTTLGRHYI